MTDKCRKPDPEQFEREQRDLFQYKDITDTSNHSGIRYGTLSKGLNPNDPTPSITTEFLMFLYGCHVTRPELEEGVWALVSRYRRQMFPKPADSPNGFDATYFDLKATLARFEDGYATEADLEAAKNRHAEATGRVGGCRHESLREQKV